LKDHVACGEVETSMCRSRIGRGVKDRRIGYQRGLCRVELHFRSRQRMIHVQNRNISTIEWTTNRRKAEGTRRLSCTVLLFFFPCCNTLIPLNPLFSLLPIVSGLVFLSHQNIRLRIRQMRRDKDLTCFSSSVMVFHRAPSS